MASAITAFCIRRKSGLVMPVCFLSLQDFQDELFFNMKEQLGTYVISAKTVSNYYKETSNMIDSLQLEKGDRLEKTFSKLTLWREGGIPPTSEGMSLGLSWYYTLQLYF